MAIAVEFVGGCVEVESWGIFFRGGGEAELGWVWRD